MDRKTPDDSISDLLFKIIILGDPGSISFPIDLNPLNFDPKPLENPASSTNLSEMNLKRIML